MDETSVYLDLVPNKVVDRKGKKSVRVHTTSFEKKSDYCDLVLYCV